MRIILFAFGCLLFPQLAFGAGFTVTPMLQEILLEGSESKEADVRVTNTTDEAVVFELSAIDFQGLDESGGIAFLGKEKEGSESYPLAAWIEPEENSLTIPPQESTTVRVKIRNDDTLSPGGHYGALVFRQVFSEPSLDQPKVALQQVFTALFLAKKLDGALYGMELEKWQEETSLFNPLSSHEITFRATGNVHVVPRGEIGITDPLGRQVAKGIINEASAIVLPGETRKYSVQIFPLSSLWLPGKYQMILKYRYDGKESVDTQEKTTFFVPLRFVVATVSVVFVLVGAIVYRRRYKKNERV